MRGVIAGLIALWIVLTVVAYAVVLPDSVQRDEVVLALFDVGATVEPGSLPDRLRFLEDSWPPDLARVRAGEIEALPAAEAREQIGRMRAWFDDEARRQGLTLLEETPVLVWSTDDNPARRVQTRLFRAWHLRTYGEAIDIVTDPSNRDITKTVVQCIAGSGPDIIEAYGPAELRQFVGAGVALDVTEMARERGFGVDRVFGAAVSSIAKGGRQYAFPCNVGYTVLFFHRDLFEEAGLTPPSAHEGGWTLEEMTRAARTLQERAARDGTRRVGLMGMYPWPMTLAEGARFFNDEATASFFAGPEAIGALRAYQDLMYEQRVMPTPGEAASMASSGGANMNADAASASASSLFAAKVAAMITDGRWSYVSLATRNRDRVIRPAIERRLAEIGAESQEATRLRAALSTLTTDVLLPLSDEQYAAMEACLTPDDRSRLIQLGIAHVPTISGTPWYETAARVAIVNRASPRATYAVRFLEFLASEAYNEQINGAFDSICGVPEYCLDDDGIAGPPRALPGLEAFDSPIFARAMLEYADDWELSPFIGRSRLGVLVTPIFDAVTNNEMTPTEAAQLIESRINDQIHANLVRDSQLRIEWARRVGKAFDPARGVKEQVSRSSDGGGES